MNANKRILAAVELFLVFPATLFMTSLFVRSIQPSPYEPAETARRVVDWFGARPFLGLDICLVALPFMALVVGAVSVVRYWRNDEELRRTVFGTLAAVRAHLAALLIAGATLAAGGILMIVAVHVMTD